MVCAECRTANRGESSKFCKGCGRRLSFRTDAPAVAVAAVVAEDPIDSLPGIDDEWPATQRMAYHPDMDLGVLSDRLTPASAAADAAEAVARARKAVPPPRAALPASTLPDRSARRDSSRGSSHARKVRGQRRSIASRLGTWVLTIAVITAVALGWGYVYNSRNSAVPALAKEAPIPAPAQPVETPPVLLAAEPALVPAAPVATAASPVEELPVAPSKPASAAAKSRKAAAPVAAAPPPSTPAPTEPAPAPPPEPAAPATPQSLCAGLNFFARAQCMAAQCAKADYRSHTQCEAVRRQQQIEEEKRNPTLIN